MAYHILIALGNLSECLSILPNLPNFLFQASEVKPSKDMMPETQD